MITEDKLKQLIEIKNKQRAAFKAEFRKQITNPHRHGTGEGGTVFNSGIQRWMAMEATQYDYFKPNTKNAVRGLLFFAIPFALTLYMVNTTRDAQEKLYRTGMVSYRDREWKFK